MARCFLAGDYPEISCYVLNRSLCNYSIKHCWSNWRGVRVSAMPPPPERCKPKNHPLIYYLFLVMFPRVLAHTIQGHTGCLVSWWTTIMMILSHIMKIFCVSDILHVKEPSIHAPIEGEPKWKLWSLEAVRKPGICNGSGSCTICFGSRKAIKSVP